jgi:ribosomal protein S18 acetylase RimI-like enzyme
MRPGAVTTFFSAFDDFHRMLGFVCYGETPLTDKVYDLYWLAVDSLAHGRGVARELLHSLEGLLKAKGARILLVETSSRLIYEKARIFYTHNGFIEEARVHDFYSTGDDRVIYKKNLL